MSLQPKIEAYLRSIDLEVIESTMEEKEPGKYELKLVLVMNEPEEKRDVEQKNNLPLLPLKSLLALAGPNCLLDVHRNHSSRD